MTATVAILVPGITGTALYSRTWGQNVWPDGLQWVSHGDFVSAMTSLDKTSATQVLTEVKLLDGLDQIHVYDTMISRFQQAGFQWFPDVTALSTPASRALIGFPYDWRLDNLSAAGLLLQTLRRIDRTYGGEYRLHLVAHSMGGLVCRCLLESPNHAIGPFLDKIDGLFAVGTPHLGAPEALGAITGQMPLTWLEGLFIDKDTVPEIVNAPGIVSTYQLLPPPRVKFVISTTQDSELLAATDPSSPIYGLLMSSSGFGLPEASMASAQSFFSNLSPRPMLASRYHLLAGTGSDTIIAFNYDPTGSTAARRLLQNPPAPATGDGVVPLWSAIPSTIPTTNTYHAPGVQHLSLLLDAGVQSYILKAMGF